MGQFAQSDKWQKFILLEGLRRVFFSPDCPALPCSRSVHSSAASSQTMGSYIHACSVCIKLPFLSPPPGNGGDSGDKRL